jgi:prevent-host-death family protein
MSQFNIHQAKTKLSEIIAMVELGEEVVIARSGKPVAKIVPLDKQKPKKRQFGQLEGKITIPDDFDEPLPDWLLDAFEGK